MSLRFVFSLLICLCGLAVHTARAEVLALQRFQAEHGLVNVQVLSAHPDGHIWVGTQSGLFLFNGLSFTAQDMPTRLTRDIRDVIPMTASQTWVLTALGVWIRQETGERVSWHEVTFPDGSRLSVDGKQRIVTDPDGAVRILDRHSRLWKVNVPAALIGDLRLPKDAFMRIPDIQRTGSMWSGPLLSVGDRLWMGCSTGLCSLDGEQLRSWGEAEGLPKARWSSLLRGRDGTLWARSSMYLARLNSTDGRFTPIKAPREDNISGIMLLAQDERGRIFVSGVGGMARWNGVSWQEFGSRNGLPDVGLNALHFGGDGSVWIATGGEGLLRWSGYERAKHWSTESGLPGPAVWKLVRDGGGRLVVATSRGVAISNQDGSFTPVLTDLTKAELVDSVVSDSKGQVWWVQADGLYRLSPNKTRADRVWASSELLGIFAGQEAIYLRTRSYVLRFFPGASNLNIERLPEGLPSSQLNGVFGAGGREWLVIGAKAMTHWSGQWHVLQAGDRPFEVLGEIAVRSDGRMWMVHPSGLSVHSLNGVQAKLDQLIDASTLGAIDVGDIEVDSLDRLWATVERGALSYDGSAWMFWGLADGLLSVDLTGALLLDEGSLWLGSTTGLTRLEGKSVAATDAKLEIQQVRVNGERVARAPGLWLPAENSSIQLTLATKEHGKAYRRWPEYRFVSEGKWHQMPSDTLELASLGAGRYELEFRLAAVNGLVAPGPSITWAFDVPAPWWRSPYTLLGAFMVLIWAWRASLSQVRRRAVRRHTELEIAIAERTREVDESRDALRRLGHQNVRLIEEERLKLARELHDELGQELIALRIELSLAAMAIRNGAEALSESAVLALRERVSNLINGVRRVVASLRPLALDGGFEAGIRWLVAQFESRGQARCSLTMDWQPVQPDQELDTAVFRIVQEALNNVTKHTSATSVDLSVTLRAQILDVLVTDNGGGFNLSGSSSTGFGLMGMRERALMIGASLDITNEPGRGVIVRLRADLG